MQAQYFDVSDIEAIILHARQDFRKRRNVAAWKDILVDPGTGGTRPARSIDRMEHADAVVPKEFAAFGEELVEVPKPDVLEHSDRDDAVEALVKAAIVDQAELDAVRYAALPRPLVRELGGKVTLLSKLGLVERGLGGFEIST